MSHYSPVFTNVSNNVSERWNLVRTFIERWYEVKIPKVDYAKQIQEIENELGLELPLSFKHYITLSQQLLSSETRYANGYKTNLYTQLFGDNFKVNLLQEHQVVSLMLQGEGDFYWAIKTADLHLEDPAVHGYILDYEGDPTKFNYVSQMYRGLTAFVLGHLFSYLRSENGSGFSIMTEKNQELLDLLGGSFTSHAHVDGIDIFEREDMLAYLEKAPFEEDPNQYVLAVHLWQELDRDKIPQHIWKLSEEAGWMYGMFTGSSKGQ